MNVDIVTLIANTGGTLGLAIFAIWMLNKVWKDRLAESQKSVEEQREMWRCTREALEENTRVISLWLEREKKSRDV
mgnify:FL=1